MFVPQTGSMLTIELPGEILRAQVEKVVSKDAVVARIMSQPMARTHHYPKGALVACQRKRGIMGEVWEALEEHREEPVPIPKQESPKPKKRVEKEKPKKKSKGAKKNAA